MKIPKQLIRDPQTGAKILVRPHKLAVDASGTVHRIDAHNTRGYELPQGMRWATERDEHHDEARAGAEHRRATLRGGANASPKRSAKGAPST